MGCGSGKSPTIVVPAHMYALCTCLILWTCLQRTLAKDRVGFSAVIEQHVLTLQVLENGVLIQRASFPERYVELLSVLLSREVTII